MNDLLRGKRLRFYMNVVNTLYKITFKMKDKEEGKKFTTKIKLYQTLDFYDKRGII